MQGCQPQRNILKVKEMYIKSKEIIYKYLKNLEIFFLHIAMCSEIVSHYVQNYYSLSLLVPSASSASSLKITSADRPLRVLYEICILYLFL